MNNQDTELIFESYKAINVKQLVLESSYETFEKNAPNVETLEEATAILEIYNEAFPALAGLKALGGVAKAGMGSVGKAAKAKIADTAQAAAQKVGDVAKSTASGVSAAAKQGVQNVKDIAGTAANEAKAKNLIADAQKAAQEIINLVNQAKQLSPETFVDARGRAKGETIENLRLGQIMTHLDNLSKNVGAAKQAAAGKGFTSGLGQAFQQGAAGESNEENNEFKVGDMAVLDGNTAVEITEVDGETIFCTDDSGGEHECTAARLNKSSENYENEKAHENGE